MSESQPLLSGDVAINVVEGKTGTTASNCQTNNAHGGLAFLEPGGTWASVYTLSAMSLGVGVFVLPLVLSSLGVIPGVAAILLFGLWSYAMQMQLIVEAQKHQPTLFRYEDLVEARLGSIGKLALALFSCVTMLIGNAAHMKTVVYLLHDALEWYITDSYGKVKFDIRKELVLYFVLFALAMVANGRSDLNSLRFISTASVGTVLFTCVWTSLECMLFYWPKGHHFFTGPDAPPLFGTDWRSYASDLPAIAFAFTGTFCLFPVFAEAKDKSYAAIDKSVFLSTVICAVGYQFVSVIGAYTFGNDIGKDTFSGGESKSFLYDFPPSHVVVSICCLALVVTITLLYNVIEYPMISAVEELIQMLPLPACIDYRQSFLQWRWHRSVISLCGMVVVVFINLQFSSLVVLFGLCGGYGITLVTYTIPSILVMVSPNVHWFKRGLMFLSFAASVFLVAIFTIVTF